MKKMIVAAAALAALAGCVPKGGPGASTYFECDRGTKLQVDFAGQTAFVRVNGADPLRIPAMQAASGARYSSGTHELWTKGDTATWTVGRMVPEQCRQVVLPR